MIKRERQPESDDEIVQRVIGGDVNAFERLLKKHNDHVLKIVKKHVPYDRIEETAQDVFVRAYNSLPGFKRTGSFKGWLSVIAVRTCHDFWRGQYGSRELPVSDLSEKQKRWLEKNAADRSDSFHREKRFRSEIREMLDQALDKLSAADRMVLELVYLEGCSIKEAAKLLGWSTANVKVRSFRAREKIHKLLGPYFETA